MRAAETPGQGVQLVETWPIEVYVNFHLVDGQPEWPRRMLSKFEWVNEAVQTKDHALDVACPVEMVAASVTVYKVDEDGFTEGGGPIDKLHMPHDTPQQRPGRRFDVSRLYLAPGPGWAFTRVIENASYAWVGKWAEGSPRGRGDSTEGLIDPWGRRGGWVIAHELGHLTGANHLVVYRPERCSFMSYGEQMFPIRPASQMCPNLGKRMLREQCDGWLIKARMANTPPTSSADVNGDGRVDKADVATVRAILEGKRTATAPPPCLGWMSRGKCQLFPEGDINRDLTVDSLDLQSFTDFGVEISGEGASQGTSQLRSPGQPAHTVR